MFRTVILTPTSLFPKSQFPHAALLFIAYYPNPYYNLVRFRHQNEELAYAAKVTEIRNVIATAVARARNEEGFDYDGWCRNRWIPMVDQFISLYMNYRVPEDIRKSFNNERKRLGLKEIDFPDVEIITDV